MSAAQKNAAQSGDCTVRAILPSLLWVVCVVLACTILFEFFFRFSLRGTIWLHPIRSELGGEKLVTKIGARWKIRTTDERQIPTVDVSSFVRVGMSKVAYSTSPTSITRLLEDTECQGLKEILSSSMEIRAAKKEEIYIQQFERPLYCTLPYLLIQFSTWCYSNSIDLGGGRI